MPNGETRVRATEAAELFSDLGFVADQDDLDVQLGHRLDGPLNGREWTVIPSHRINRDFHRMRRSRGRNLVGYQVSSTAITAMPL
jgi:hypothetical protein